MALKNSKTGLCYSDAGTGPALVFIHGFPLCGAMWNAQVDDLVDAGFRVIVPNLPGVGSSRSLELPEASMDGYADLLISLADELGIARLSFVGMSMGGYILLNLLRRFPARVDTACLVTTRAGADDAVTRLKRDSMMEEVRNGRASLVSRTFGPTLFSARNAKDHAELIRQLESCLALMSDEGMMDALQAMKNRPDSEPFLSDISCPCLIIAGEEDQIVPLDQTLLLERAVPHNRTCLIAHAGHMANMEQPAIFNDCLISFLREELVLA